METVQAINEDSYLQKIFSLYEFSSRMLLWEDILSTNNIQPMKLSSRMLLWEDSLSRNNIQPMKFSSGMLLWEDTLFTNNIQPGWNSVMECYCERIRCPQIIFNL